MNGIGICFFDDDFVIGFLNMFIVMIVKFILYKFNKDDVVVVGIRVFDKIIYGCGWDVL